MNKKILIGSIIAVVILVLVSFTGVVGYSSVKSNSGKVSPLFSVRTNRAIGEESKDLTCNYIRMGNILPFPKRDDRTVTIQKVIDSIRRMDDETFENFIAYIIDPTRKDNRLNGINPDRIREALYLLRDSDKPIPIFDTIPENSTYGYGFKGLLSCTFSEQLCFIKIILVFIARLILKIMCAIAPPPVGSVMVCPPPTI
jgi:hypothetical protein